MIGLREGRWCDIVCCTVHLAAQIPRLAAVLTAASRWLLLVLLVLLAAAGYCVHRTANYCVLLRVAIRDGWSSSTQAGPSPATNANCCCCTLLLFCSPIIHQLVAWPFASHDKKSTAHRQPVLSSPLLQSSVFVSPCPGQRPSINLAHRDCLAVGVPGPVRRPAALSWTLITATRCLAGPRSASHQTLCVACHSLNRVAICLRA